MTAQTYTLTELTQGLDVTIQGDPLCVISGVSTIQEATAGQISFLNNALYRKFLESTQASAVILTAEEASHYPGNAIVCRNPYYVYAKIAAYFEMPRAIASSVHASAVIAETAEIHPSVSIGANAVIGERVKIGRDSIIDANVTLYHDVVIGERVRIASGVVIGADGFGFANEKRAWHKVPQLGRVVIGDDVDVGANTTIDRGAIDDTVIEDGVKLDNLIQVGHNVRIGAHTIIAGCVAIAGSVTIGKYCMIGGASCFAGHISVCDGAIITGMTAVTKSISEAGMYSSGIVGAVPTHEFRKNNARFHRLENLMQRVKTLETTLKAMTEISEA